MSEGSSSTISLITPRALLLQWSVSSHFWTTKSSSKKWSWTSPKSEEMISSHRWRNYSEERRSLPEMQLRSKTRDCKKNSSRRIRTSVTARTNSICLIKRTRCSSRRLPGLIIWLPSPLLLSTILVKLCLSECKRWVDRTWQSCRWHSNNRTLTWKRKGTILRVMHNNILSLQM